MGTYCVTVTDQNGCTEVLCTAVNQPDQLVASIVSTDAKCTFSNGSASVVGTSGGTNPYTFLWSNSQITATATGLYPTDYGVVVTDAMGCTLALNVTVSDQPGPAVDNIVITDPLCFGDCDGTATADVSGGTSPLTFHWNDVSQQAGQTAAGLCAGNYCVTVTDDNGCLAADCGTVVQPPSLIVNFASGVLQLCAGQTGNISIAAEGGSGGFTFVWGDYGDSLGIVGPGPHSVTPEPSTIEPYSVTVTDANGCTANNTMIVNTGPQLLVDMPDTVETCLGNPVLISSTGYGGTAIADYQWVWSTGDSASAVITTAIEVSPTDTTTYFVVLSDGCSAPATGTIIVVVNPIPTPSFGVLENEGCPPLEAYFNGSSSMDNSIMEWDFQGDGIVDYVDSNLYQGDFSNPIFFYEESGMYTVVVTVISEHRCTTTVSIQDYINIYPTPVASFEVYPEIATLLNPFVEVNANASVGVDSLYIWDFNDPYNTESGFGVINEHVYSDTGWYGIALDVVNVHGCHDYDTVMFRVDPDFAIYAPNAFTPNDDGKNDGFKLFGVGVDRDNFELSIYDRWGEMIYYTQDFDAVWDGSIKNSTKLAPNDVYIWKAFAKPMNTSDRKDPEEFIGTVTVVK